MSTADDVHIDDVVMAFEMRNEQQESTEKQMAAIEFGEYVSEIVEDRVMCSVT